MIDELLLWMTVPVALIGGAAATPVSIRICRRMMRVHMMIMCIVCAVYVILRRRFMTNLREPVRDTLDDACSSFFHSGMQVLWFRPSRLAKRKVIIFAGVRNCVRRTLRHSFVEALLTDCLILVVQMRGLGNSDTTVHMNRSTLLQDAVAAYQLMLPTRIPLHIMGFSAGSFVAMQLCASLPCDSYASTIIVGGMFDCMNVSLDMRIACMALRMYQHELTRHVAGTVVLLHSTQDERIGIEEAERHEAMRQAERLPVVFIQTGGPHHRYTMTPEGNRAFRDVLVTCDRVHKQRSVHV